MAETSGKTKIIHLHVLQSGRKMTLFYFTEKIYIADTHIFGVIIRNNNVQFHANRCSLVIFYDYLRSDKQVTSVRKYGILYSPVVFQEIWILFYFGKKTRYGSICSTFFLLNLRGSEYFLGFRHRLTTTSSVYINQMCCYGIEKFSKIFCNSNAEELQFFLLTTAQCT